MKLSTSNKKTIAKEVLLLTLTLVISGIIGGFFWANNLYYKSKAESIYSEINNLITSRDSIDLEKVQNIRDVFSVSSRPYTDFNIRLIDTSFRRLLYDSINSSSFKGAFKDYNEFEDFLTIKHPINFISYREKIYHYSNKVGIKNSYAAFNKKIETDTIFSRLTYRNLASNYKIEEILSKEFIYKLNKKDRLELDQIVAELVKKQESEDYIQFIVNVFQSKNGNINKPIKASQLTSLNSTLKKLDFLAKDYLEYVFKIKNKTELLQIFNMALAVFVILFYPVRFIILAILWSIKTLKN